ncbi:NOT2/NOT3/NOT5 domain-containing protein [Venturia nashicola]|uniref:NOT2/NOT3/NOT5 domain-containing protein n=1 Tax=Venturia nashicola TaxID=86259 RepID=A0A4Z1PEY7_9PEZI|nr:NOT2/NOT3/NOT5 domain-containing protein [Venturia nashicola]TLD36434.1 NOT2/NOT3/NOT5 domain-containing protein [Venturia nashicola]
MFSQNENRPVAAARGRMQNGKIDQFSFSIGNGGSVPALNAQSRQPSFAQISGSQQSSRPLDLSEFPSLGGNVQAQQQNASFAPGVSPWRATRSPAPERARYVGIGRGRGQPQEDAYQFGQPTGANQLSGLAQQTGIQSSRLGLTSPAGDQGERTTTSTIGDDRHGGDRSSTTRNVRTVANPFQNQQDQGPIGYTGRAPGTSDQAPTEPASSPQATNSSKQKRLSEMAEQERWGMPGLLAKINAESPDYDPLAVGMNIQELGLNLDSTEPLLPTWGSPFDDRPVVPTFALPQAYTVTNVPPLATKLDSFCDETLIMIFYQWPRDILQEMAAQTLYKRDWRWHKELRQWMMKDAQYGGAPTRINHQQERGYYIFFDVNNWRRERREFVLDYEHLDSKPTSGLLGFSAAAGAVVQQNGVGVGVGAGPSAQLLGNAFPGAVGGIGGGISGL